MEAIATIRFSESGILYRAGVDLAISTLERVIRFVCQSRLWETGKEPAC
jgi:hypothetical protein